MVEFLDFRNLYVIGRNSRITHQPDCTNLPSIRLFWLKNPEELWPAEGRGKISTDALHDLAVLGLHVPITQEVAQKFLLSKGWRWLVSEAKVVRYFGLLSDVLHDTLLDEPAAYQKDVKGLLSNLIAWGQYFHPERCIVDKPKFSERVKIIR